MTLTWISLAVAAVALALIAAHWLSALDDAQRNLCRRMGAPR